MSNNRYYQNQDQDQNPSQNPWSDAPSQNENPYPQQHAPPSSDHPAYQSQTHPQQEYQAYAPPTGAPPGVGVGSNPSQPPLPARHEQAGLPTGSDRAEQVEQMQAYEAAVESGGGKDEDSRNQEILEREFPKLDGSLIAAIYGDSKSLSATREMLHELNEGAQ